MHLHFYWFLSINISFSYRFWFKFNHYILMDIIQVQLDFDMCNWYQSRAMSINYALNFAFIGFDAFYSIDTRDILIFSNEIIQLFIEGLMVSYLRYLCLLAHNGVQHILCCVFVLFFFVLCYPMLQVFLDCPFLIIPSVFSNVYFTQYNKTFLLFLTY